MTKAEYLLKQSDEAMQKALRTNDKNLETFYFNASKGFLDKLRNLTVVEASQEV